jgi:polysaccharide pyruvyl transferase WcaK-like protein
MVYRIDFMKDEDLLLYGGTYLNKGGAAIAYGTFKALSDIRVNYRTIIDPEPFFAFNSLNLRPIFRYSDILSMSPLKSVKLRYTYKPFIKCIVNTYNPEIYELKGLPIWHIGDSPFSDSRSFLSVAGQIVALESLRKVIKSKVIIGGVSIDTPKTRVGRYLMEKHFKNYYFFVRGNYTFKNLLRLGVPESSMVRMCDFAFQLTGIRNKATEEVSRIISEFNKPKIALCLRDFSIGDNAANNLASIKKFIVILKDHYSLFLVPTSYAYLNSENDQLFSQQKLNMANCSMLDIKNNTPEEIIDIFGNFDLVISSRLHGAVYGALANVPTIHLYEGYKSLEVIGDSFGDTIPLVKLTDFAKGKNIEELISLIARMISNKEDISYKLKRLVKNAKDFSIKEIDHSLNKYFWDIL